MEYRILGPLEVLGDDGTPVALAGMRERTCSRASCSRRTTWSRPTGSSTCFWGEEPPERLKRPPGVRLQAEEKARICVEHGARSAPASRLRAYDSPGRARRRRFEELVRLSETTGQKRRWRGSVRRCRSGEEMSLPVLLLKSPLLTAPASTSFASSQSSGASKRSFRLASTTSSWLVSNHSRAKIRFVNS